MPAYLGLLLVNKGVWHGLGTMTPLPLDSGPSKYQVWWRARSGNRAQGEGACCVSGRYSCLLAESLTHQCVRVLFSSTFPFTVPLYSLLICTKLILSCLHIRSLLANPTLCKVSRLASLFSSLLHLPQAHTPIHLIRLHLLNAECI